MRMGNSFAIVLGLGLAVVGCGSSGDSSNAIAPTALPPLALNRACDDALDGLYKTPSGLPGFSDGVRGEVVGCAKVETITAADVKKRLAGVPDAVVTSGDVHVYMIAYRTEREPVSGAISTAFVYLPDVPRADRVPMVLAEHGTVGLADSCAPSEMMLHPQGAFLHQDYFDSFELAWAARGMPVVAPDYAGLGTDGIHGYDSWLDSARSALDGARALRSLLPAARLDGGTLVEGHSQGGGIALSSAAYSGEAPDLDLRAVVAFAPQYRITSLASALGFSSLKLTPGLRGYAAYSLYAGLASLSPDSTHWGDAFAVSVRDYIVKATSTLCLTDLDLALTTAAPGYVPPATIGDMIDPTFAAAVTACASGKACNGLPGAWQKRDKANEPHLPAGSPPVLVVASTTDEQVVIGQVGCALSRIQKDGDPADTCVYEGFGHLAVVAASASYAIDWALAASGGAARPVCKGTGQPAACKLF